MRPSINSTSCFEIARPSPVPPYLRVVELSAWEDEFLGPVGERIKTYGRAFGDPDKGAPGQALSMMQAVKLKEIAAKAKGEKRGFRVRRKSERTDGGDSER